MNSKLEKKLIIVVRRTRLEELIARFNTLDQARFYVEHLGADFSDYEQEDRNYKKALREVESQLRNIGLVQVLDRAFLPNFIFAAEDTVVVLGQDGLVANTLKYLNGQPVVGINPDPKRWEGVLLPFQVIDAGKVAAEATVRKRNVSEITMAQVQLNDGQRLYGVNDLFIGPQSHISIRYEIMLGDKKEQHSSSGIIVSTGLGSTGWLKSILTGTNGICDALGKPLKIKNLKNFKWDSDHLYFTVREPWPSKFSQATLVFDKITQDRPLVLVSQMPEKGVIFSDGMEQDYLEFNSGTRAVITIADKKGCLVV